MRGQTSSQLIWIVLFNYNRDSFYATEHCGSVSDVFHSKIAYRQDLFFPERIATITFSGSYFKRPNIKTMFKDKKRIAVKQKQQTLCHERNYDQIFRAAS